MAQKFLTAKEVATQLHVAESTAYVIIRRWNKELEEMGYFVKQALYRKHILQRSVMDIQMSNRCTYFCVRNM